MWPEAHSGLVVCCTHATKTIFMWVSRLISLPKPAASGSIHTTSEMEVGPGPNPGALCLTLEKLSNEKIPHRIGSTGCC